MTPKFKYLFLAITLLLAVFISCKKRLFDHRNKYLGDYTFSVTKMNWTSNSTVTTESHEEHNGSITYDKKRESKGTIILNLLSNMTVTANISKDGELTLDCPYKGEGTFADKNNVNLKIYSGGGSCAGMGHGGGTNYTVTGVKN